ncbi:MAG: hypothetical protein AAF468_04240 [Pseudomonadota bacterium]
MLLFCAILFSIWFLVGGVLSLALGIPYADEVLAKILFGIAGPILIVSAIWLALKSYALFRTRLDPVNDAAIYRAKLLNRLRGK